MNRLFVATLLLLPSLGLASATGNESHGAIPTAVWLQFINFGLYVALLVFVLRKPAVSFFANRKTSYHEALKKAEAAKVEAESKRREIQERLTKLESSREQAIEQARAEASALRAQIVEEAKSLATKLKADAEMTASVELERAKVALRQELLDQSVVLARKLLSDKEKLQDQDQKRLQAEFVDKIQVVSQ